MEGLDIIVKPYDESNQQYRSAIDLLEPVIAVLEERLEVGKKTRFRALQLHVCFKIAQHFLRENNLRAAQATLMKQTRLAEEYKKVFYNDKRKKSDACRLLVAFLNETKRLSA